MLTVLLLPRPWFPVVIFTAGRASGATRRKMDSLIRSLLTHEIELFFRWFYAHLRSDSRIAEKTSLKRLLIIWNTSELQTTTVPDKLYAYRVKDEYYLVVWSKSDTLYLF